MAKVDDDLDLDVEAGGKKGGGKMKSIIIFSVIAVLLIGLSVGLTVMLVGGGKEPAAGTEKHAEGTVGAGEKHGGEEGHSESATVAYLDLDPAFVVNLDSKESDIRYLQIKMSVMVEKEADLAVVKKHTPVIRHHLNMLFSSLDFNEISSREGKTKLTEESLKVIRDSLEKVEGTPVVKAVFFNSIIGQ